MTWLTWRQHRGEALVIALLVAAIAIVLVVLGRPMHELFPVGASACETPPVDPACRSGIVALQQDYGYANALLALLGLVPFAIGAFIGAPLLARELESGTWQLAWTQAVPRMRWLAVKLSVLGVLIVLMTAALSSVTTWYRQPLDLFGRFQISGFDVTGVVPVGYALFAFAVATAAGLLLRRSLPALAVALVTFIGVRASVAVWLRPHYRTPVSLSEVVPAGSGSIDAAMDSVRDWTLGDGLSDAAGHHLPTVAGIILRHQAEESGVDPATYLHDQGIQRWVVYHPADRFWTFQFIETGIFVALSMFLLWLVVRRVRRRGV